MLLHHTLWMSALMFCSTILPVPWLFSPPLSFLSALWWNDFLQEMIFTLCCFLPPATRNQTNSGWFCGGEFRDAFMVGPQHRFHHNETSMSYSWRAEVSSVPSAGPVSLGFWISHKSSSLVPSHLEGDDEMLAVEDLKSSSLWVHRGSSWCGTWQKNMLS